MRSISPCSRNRRRSYVTRPGESWLGLIPSSGAMCSRRCLFLNVPWTRRNNSRTCKRPWTRGSAKTQRRCALLPDRYWLLHFLECSFADEAIMADALDVEQTSVGCKADLAQLSKILDTAADTKVACVVDGRFGSQCLQQLVILLDTRLLVVDVQRRHDAVGDDAGTETAWCAAGDLAVEDQAHLAWPTDVQVLADHLFEKDPPGHRPIEHLGEGELRLQD